MVEHESFHPLFREKMLLKFVNMLPHRKGLFCYFNEDVDEIYGTVYIAEKQHELTRGRKLDPERTIGYIEILLDKKDQVLNVTWVSVCKRFQGNGVGKYLMILAAELGRTLGAKIVELDDHSDMVWSRDNMYTSLGFEYIGNPPDPPNSGDPEMRGCVNVIAGKWKTYRQKYVRRPFFNS